MYIEVHEIEDDEIWSALSDWESDIECVSIGYNNVLINWKSRKVIRLRAWRVDKALRNRFGHIYHAIDGDLICEHHNERLLRAA